MAGNVLRLLVFTLLLPGTLALWLPYGLMRDYGACLNLGAARYLGWPLMAAGGVSYLWSAFVFLMQGKGTPAIWFTRRLRAVLGEEPVRMVYRGLYRYTRNPMYLGILATVLGEALWWQSTALLVYAAVLAAGFHLTVVFLEEPHLRKKYGATYEAYLRTSPRWLGRRKSG